MKRLTQHAFQQAHTFIATHGRPLDQQRFAFHFEAGTTAAVLAELAAYQNSDGGFGNGLEPDLRTPASSAIATSQAFIFLREVSAPATEPLVQRAVDYLLRVYDAEKGVWPIVPPEVEDAAHAPWWTYADSAQNFGGSIVNPRAALVGDLWSYPTLVPALFLNQITASVLTHLESMPDEMEMHDLQCYIGLAEATHLPESLRQPVQNKLRSVVPKSIALEPEAWANYNLPPLGVINAPDSFLIEVIEPTALAANLDYLIDQQQPDGTWAIPWSWDFVDEKAWAQAERDIKGSVAVNNLKLLQAFGRMEGL